MQSLIALFIDFKGNRLHNFINAGKLCVVFIAIKENKQHTYTWQYEYHAVKKYISKYPIESKARDKKFSKDPNFLQIVAHNQQMKDLILFFLSLRLFWFSI